MSSSTEQAVVTALEAALRDVGWDAVTDPARLRAILSDLLGVHADGHRGALDALVISADEGIPSDLKAVGRSGAANVRPELMERLQEWGLTAQRAAWVLDAWESLIPESLPPPPVTEPPPPTELPPVTLPPPVVETTLPPTSLPADPEPAESATATPLPPNEATELPPAPVAPDELTALPLLPCPPISSQPIWNQPISNRPIRRRRRHSPQLRFPPTHSRQPTTSSPSRRLPQGHAGFGSPPPWCWYSPSVVARSQR